LFPDLSYRGILHLMVILLLVVFIIGYTAIALENKLSINKAATALITGVVCWTIYIAWSPDKHVVEEQLTLHLGELSGILFFLLSAMTIVELIDAHDGFNIITDRINQTSQRKLICIIAFITFFLSALLDNLTTTIVMVSLIRKLINDQKQRLYFSCIIIIAANAGGAWSPIGDVTTTMLWIGGQITSVNLIINLILPSIVCLLIPLVILSTRIKGDITRPEVENNAFRIVTLPLHQQKIVFFSGMLMLVLVPVFKTVTHLPPYMGILIGLGVLWVITEIMHEKKAEPEKQQLSVSQALQKVDSPTILFFLGILLNITALQSSGMLATLAGWVNDKIGSEHIIALCFGILSSVVDNVPLVAAGQGMYSLEQYPTDLSFWIFLAYTAGTGGSALIIGSAAGVAAMGMEKIDFFQYLKKITLIALAGYFAGALIYMLQYYLFH
jgi:Na+/H+ antiporter NhaD/arsenite permease-like protein